MLRKRQWIPILGFDYYGINDGLCQGNASSNAGYERCRARRIRITHERMKRRLSHLLETVVTREDEEETSSRVRLWAYYLALGIGIGLASHLLFTHVPFFRRTELNTLDLRFRLRPAIHMSPRIGSVDIDQAAIEQAGSWPIPRKNYAEFMRVLKNYDAALMSMDIFVPDPSPLIVSKDQMGTALKWAREGETAPGALHRLLARLAVGADAEMIAAMRETGLTVLAQTFEMADREAYPDAADVQRATRLAGRMIKPDHKRSLELAKAFSVPFECPGLRNDSIARAYLVEPPDPALLKHASGLGFAQIIHDVDGTVRKYPLFIHYEGRLYPSLALMSVSLVSGVPLEKIVVVPGEYVLIPGARVWDRDGNPQVTDIRIPVDKALRMLTNWAGDYHDTFVHFPANKLLRFRGIDLFRERLQQAGDDLDRLVGETFAGMIQEVIDRRLLKPGPAHEVARELLLAWFAEHAMDGGTSRDAFVTGHAPAQDVETRALLGKVWDQIANNRKILDRLRRDPDTTYASVKAELGIPDAMDPIQRHATRMLRFILKRGKDPARWRPHYFFPPLELSLSGRETKVALSPLELADRILFVGLTATGTHDYNPIPFSPRYPMVGLHLNAASTMLTRQFLRVLPEWAEILIVVFCALIMASLAPLLHPLAGAGFLLVIEGIYFYAMKKAFDNAGLWLPAVAPFVAVMLTYLTIVIRRFFTEQLEKRKVRQEFLTYQTRIESELRIARDIQASSLPRTFPPFPNRTEFDLFASMDPAKEVGGDLYDFFFVDKHTLFTVVGDVSGKGVPAALFMMTVKTLLRTEAMRGLPAEQMLSNVNNLVYPENDSLMFVTILCAMLDVRTGDLRFGNAGHNPPLISVADGGFQYSELPPSPVLGVSHDTTFTTAHVRLSPGEVLFLYTDGVTEATDEREELYGEDRLQDTLSRFPDRGMREMVHGVRSALKAFTRQTPQSDDITMLGLRFNGAGS